MEGGWAVVILNDSDWHERKLAVVFYHGHLSIYLIRDKICVVKPQGNEHNNRKQWKKCITKGNFDRLEIKCKI